MENQLERTLEHEMDTEGIWRVWSLCASGFTQELLGSYFWVCYGSLVRDDHILPKRGLHRTVWVRVLNFLNLRDPHPPHVL